MARNGLIRQGWLEQWPAAVPRSSLNPEMRDGPPRAAATASESKEHRRQGEPSPELPNGVWASRVPPRTEGDEGGGVGWLVSIPLPPCNPHCFKTHLFSDPQAP